jgi:chemotaxis signal transduction protein/CheY-like chemotaxis protein/ABC-type nitrate/sulfonate/bicarbonate transport system substrate-binding protein
MQLDANMKILVVEDSSSMRRMELKILNQLGYTQILEAVDGRQAIERFEFHQDIQMVISDWHMPNMDGLELLRWLRAHESFAKVPFIMATGQGDKKHVLEATENGASGVVAKPFSPDELKNTIHSIFGINIESAPTKTPLPQRSSDGRTMLRVAHIQITDHLALGVLKNHIEIGRKVPQTFSLETCCMANWNMVQSALEKNEVDAACILAPVAMDLFNYGVPLRLVLFTHRNGSIMVRNNSVSYQQPYAQFFKHKTFFIPHKMSIHHMLSHKYFSEMGLRPGVPGKEAVNVLFDVVAPINMPEFLAENQNVGGFMVAEPIGSRAINAGIAEKQFLSSEIWDNHPCCALVFRQDIIQKYPDAVQEFTGMIVESGKFIQAFPGPSSDIAVQFLDPQKKLGFNPSLLMNVLTQPGGIRTDNLYPVLEDLDIMQRYMVEKMGIGALVNLEKFVDTRFADIACKSIASTNPDNKEVPTIQTDASPSKAEKTTVKSLQLKTTQEASLKTMVCVTREGKYLVFRIGAEKYGIPIMDVREIIGMVPITPTIKAPRYVKGMINLRGKIIPIIDFRLKLNLPPLEYTARTCIIVVEIAAAGGSQPMGVVVDSVNEVSNISEEMIQDTPQFGTMVNTSCIKGIAQINNGVAILLDIEQVLSTAA